MNPSQATAWAHSLTRCETGGISLVKFCYSEFKHAGTKRLRKIAREEFVTPEKLARWICPCMRLRQPIAHG